MILSMGDSARYYDLRENQVSERKIKIIALSPNEKPGFLPLRCVSYELKKNEKYYPVGISRLFYFPFLSLLVLVTIFSISSSCSQPRYGFIKFFLIFKKMGF